MKFKKIIAAFVASLCVMSMCVACSKNNAATDTTDKNGLTDSMDELKDDVKDTADNIKDDIKDTSDGFGMDNTNPNNTTNN